MSAQMFSREELQSAAAEVAYDAAAIVDDLKFAERCEEGRAVVLGGHPRRVRTDWPRPDHPEAGPPRQRRSGRR